MTTIFIAYGSEDKGLRFPIGEPKNSHYALVTELGKDPSWSSFRQIKDGSELNVEQRNAIGVPNSHGDLVSVLSQDDLTDEVLAEAITQNEELGTSDDYVFIFSITV